MVLRTALATPRHAARTTAWGSGSAWRSHGLPGPAGRVIFLNFDGVLHPTSIEVEQERMETVIGVGLFGWLPVLDDALRPHPDVNVVVHSPWRRTRCDEELRLLLGSLGSRMVGSTPPDSCFEGIRNWLHSNPGVVSHRILDLDPPRKYPRPLPPELIVCNPTQGVAASDVLGALRTWLAR